MDWVPPDRFDEYRLVKLLGRGSMGQVWLAHDTVLDRLVAVKFLAALAGHDAPHRRFLTEARAAARVQHPNIIAVYRVGEIGPRPYLISEYVRGDSLDKIARPVAWPRLLELAIGLARGLAAAHRQGVLHRDLKPANAIVSETGEVKLLDFGLAKLLPHAAPPHAEAPAGREAATLRDFPGDPIAPQASSAPLALLPDANASTVEVPASVPARPPGGGLARPDVTSAGAVMGTPAYMSPESWRGEPATPRSDVYAFGALLYALGAGAPPHRGDSSEAVRSSALADAPPPLASAAPGIDPGFAAIVDRCLQQDPAERFASGDAVREALEALARGDRTTARGPARPPQERRLLRPPQAVLIGASLVLAFVGYHRFGAGRSHVPARCPRGMVSVPAGSFRMGSPEGEGNTDEQPPHAVALSAYCIDRTEVTVAAYDDCVARGGCSAAPLTTNWPNYSAEQVKRCSRLCNGKDHPDHPINCVDWDQAAAYCTWQGKRLPTEAEWEYAARGDDGRVYPWGTAAPGPTRLNAQGSEGEALTNHATAPLVPMYDGDDGWKATAPVGSFPGGESPFGALDMAGNVWEWTASWYGSYSVLPELNPRGSETGTSRVSRGGGWATIDPDKARATARRWVTPTTRDCDIGFRCACDN